MDTNLGLTKEEIIFELLKSVNQGDKCAYHDPLVYDFRVDIAVRQYEYMVELGIIKEEPEPTGFQSQYNFSPNK